MSGTASRRDVRIAWTLLATLAVAFLGFTVVFAPRLTNAHFGDIEFTGWSGPIGSRLLRGDRPYVDFVLPIPPGSFLLLALLEKICGRPLLLQELWLNAVMHLGMGLLAYAMARAITSPKNAVLTAVATLLTVMQLNKECAYDHTAQLVAWGSIASGTWALFAPLERTRLRFWTLTGFLAGFTLVFKQSTALGAVFGFGLAFVYLVFVETWSGHPDRARAWRMPFVHYSNGVFIGLSGVWLILLLLGSTARAFFQAVFLDGSVLKGGPKLLVENLTAYLFDNPAYPASLAWVTVFVLVGLRLFRKRGSLSIGDERERESSYRTWEMWHVGLLVVLGFGTGALLLLKGPHGYPLVWVPALDGLKWSPANGLVATSIVCAAQFVKTKTDGTWADSGRAGHAFNALFLAAFTCSLIHNTSAPEYRPYYDNNALIPLTYLVLFVVLDRADLRWLSALLLVVVLGSAGGNKFYRAMTATHPVGSSGEWAGMFTSERGTAVLRAATRARGLAGPTGTVLVLPEDVQLAALIGRPRPKLLGAVVFVDQYAPRLVANDIARLDENPPKVILIHPSEPRQWQRFFRIWSGKSGAELLIQHVLFDLLPAKYERDSTYPTTFLWEPGEMDVWVRKDRPSNPHQQTSKHETRP